MTSWRTEAMNPYLSRIALALGMVSVSPPESSGGDIPPVSECREGLVVIACTLKTPDAERLAREVATELRSELGRKTYLHQIREKGYEGVSVIVAGEATWNGTEAIRKRVKSMRPKCLAGGENSDYLRRATSSWYPFPAYTSYTGDFGW
jgi:hypothetical protein